MPSLTCPVDGHAGSGTVRTLSSNKVHCKESKFNVQKSIHMAMFSTHRVTVKLTIPNMLHHFRSCYYLAGYRDPHKFPGVGAGATGPEIMHVETMGANHHTLAFSSCIISFNI